MQAARGRRTTLSDKSGSAVCFTSQLAGTGERLELQWESVSRIYLLVCFISRGFSSRGFTVSLNHSLLWLCRTQSYASAALGQPCSLHSTDYISPGPDGQEFVTTVARHNCKTPQLFCNSESHVCEPTKPLGSQCSYDQECQSVRNLPTQKISGGRF